MKNQVLFLVILVALSQACEVGSKKNSNESRYSESAIKEKLVSLGKEPDFRKKASKLEDVFLHCLSYPGTNDTLMAIELLHLGNEFSNVNEDLKAIQYYRRGLIFLKRILPISSPKVLDTYYKIGIEYKVLKNYSNAISFFDTLDKIQNTVHDDLFFKNQLRIGQVNFELKEYGLALEHLEMIQKILEIEKNPISPWIKSELLAYLSFCERRLGHFKKAISWAKMSIPFEQLVDPDEAAREHIALGLAWNDSLQITSLPNISKSQPFLQAELHTKLAKSFYQKVLNKFASDFIIQSQDLGELYRRAKLFDQAEHELRTTIATMSGTVKNKSVFSGLYINLGETLMDKNAADEALAYYNTALTYIVPGFIPTKSKSLPSPGYSSLISVCPFSQEKNRKLTKYWILAD
jgi:tetratricopeptide (TPR) repeat protein